MYNPLKGILHYNKPIMATFPIIPTTPAFPTGPGIFDDDIDSSDDDDEIEPLTIDFGNLDDSEEDDDFDEGEDDDDNGDTQDALPAIAGNELASLMNLGKPTAAFPMPAFPMPGQRTPVQPVVPLPNYPRTGPVTPLPTQPPLGLRLAVLPTQTPMQPPMQPVTMPFPTLNKPTTLTLAPRGGPTVAPTVIPQLGGMIPQLGGMIPNTFTPGIIQTTQNVPLIPQLQGLAITPPTTVPAPILPAQPPAKTIDVAAILEKMQGISVATVTPSPAQIPADINDLLQKEADETPEDFEARRRLTLQLASIPDYKLNNSTAVTAGLIMMKKAKLGLTYDPDVEAAVSYLTSLLQRQ